MSKYGDRPHNWFESVVNKLGGDYQADMMLQGGSVMIARAFKHRFCTLDIPGTSYFEVRPVDVSIFEKTPLESFFFRAYAFGLRACRAKDLTRDGLMPLGDTNQHEYSVCAITGVSWREDDENSHLSVAMLYFQSGKLVRDDGRRPMSEMVHLEEPFLFRKVERQKR